MQNYTCAKLIADIKGRINNDEYSDEVILGYLNDAQFEILGEDKYQFLEKTHEYEEFGSGEMELPLDFQTPILAYIDGEPLEYLPIEEFQHSSSNLKYTVFSNRIFFRVSSNKCHSHVDLFYLAKPREMTSLDDEPYIPYEYKEILVLGALARIERADGNFDFAEVYRRNLDELLLNMKLRYGQREQSLKSRARLPFGMRS